MTATQIPTRMLLIVGVAVLALAALFVARPMLLEDSSSDAGSAPAATTSRRGDAGPVDVDREAHAAEDRAAARASRPRLANKLHQSRIVVVSVYAGTDAGDRAAVAAARRGAHAAGVGFAALNVLDEKVARQVQPYIGTASPPVLLVVKRPGKVVARFNGNVDETVVAQAATNAGAHAAARRARERAPSWREAGSEDDREQAWQGRDALHLRRAP